MWQVFKGLCLAYRLRKLEKKITAGTKARTKLNAKQKKLTDKYNKLSTGVNI